MRSERLLLAGSLLVASLGCTGPTSTQSPPDGAQTSVAGEKGPFAVGDKAPGFEGLIGIDDQKHSLEDYAHAKAIAIVFTCNHCPVAVDYEDRLIALHNDYAESGVQLVAINVNNLEADRLPAMKQRAEDKGFEFPYLYDPTQKVGKDYEATVTPHAYLLDGDRRLAFVGPIDDSQGGQVTQDYLRDAIDAVLAGQAPAVASEPPFGCSIKYE